MIVEKEAKRIKKRKTTTKTNWSRIVQRSSMRVFCGRMQLAIDSLHQITRTIITNCLFVLFSGSSYSRFIRRCCRFIFWVKLDNTGIYHIGGISGW